MVGKNNRVTETSSRFTRLEAAILDALAFDQSAVAPDLAEQTRKSHAGRRLNTAFGYYVEVQTNQGRPYSANGQTGRFGSVHAMIAGLRQSVCFQIELFQGRLIGIYADSYGQDTRSIDFASVHFTEIFRLDGAGRSIPVHATPHFPSQNPSRTARPSSPSAAPEVRAQIRNTLAQRPAAPTAASEAASRRPLPIMASRSATAQMDAGATARDQARSPVPEQDPLSPAAAEEARKSLLFAIWAALGAVAVFAVLAFQVPVVGAAIVALVIGRVVQNPRILDAIGASLKRAQEQQA